MWIIYRGHLGMSLLKIPQMMVMEHIEITDSWINICISNQQNLSLRFLTDSYLHYTLQYESMDICLGHIASAKLRTGI